MPTFVPVSTVGIEEQALNGIKDMDIQVTSFLSSATCYPSTLGLSRFVGNPIASENTRSYATSAVAFSTYLSGLYLRVVGVAVVTNPMKINIRIKGTL